MKNTKTKTKTKTKTNVKMNMNMNMNMNTIPLQMCKHSLGSHNIWTPPQPQVPVNQCPVSL